LPSGRFIDWTTDHSIGKSEVIALDTMELGNGDDDIRVALVIAVAQVSDKRTLPPSFSAWTLIIVWDFLENR
jgi:hypothetical protein